MAAKRERQERVLCSRQPGRCGHSVGTLARAHPDQTPWMWCFKTCISEETLSYPTGSWEYITLSLDTLLLQFSILLVGNMGTLMGQAKCVWILGA